MPRGLIDVFPNLIVIHISTAGMKEIHQSDLKQFPRLRFLNLFDNAITIIEQDLFKFNTELELIQLGFNKITQIHPTVFDHLSQLSRLWLWSNECVNVEAYNRSAVESLIKRVKQKCRGDLNLIDEEDGSKSAP
jgi:Leucine-rich repeat (LRR) protein